jgi:N6-L-threonylcarbamoyladenine synthase
MKILAIESSCDETAAAVVEDGLTVLSNVVASQAVTHAKFGGVVPEVASRMHAECISQVVKAALSEAECAISDIEAIAVTYAPGLIGALLVGVSFAKGLAFSAGKPLVPVHHIAGHIAAVYLSSDLTPPFLAVVVSGGHTSLVDVRDYTDFNVLGRTTDDAAGEAFDKAARVMGFPYPGGVYVDKAAKAGNPLAFRLPKPQTTGSNFSFSGLKTAVVNTVHTATQRGETINNNDLAASFQKTVCEILTEKTLQAVGELSYDKIAVCGGVSANSGIRDAMTKMCAENGLKLFLPQPQYCGDNAAMIGAQGYHEYIHGVVADDYLNAFATMEIKSERIGEI